MTETALVTRNVAVMSAISVEDAVIQYQRVKALISSLFVEGVHYGTIPGTNKPTLYQAGAQQIRQFFNVEIRYEMEKEIEDWSATPPFFFYRVKCKVYRDGMPVLEAMGSCNSREMRYAYRWRDPFSAGMTMADVQALPTERKRLSSSYLPAFALRKRESQEENPKYGHPESFYQMWDDAIAAGKAAADNSRTNYKGEPMEGWKMSAWLVRFQNMETADLANTVYKLAKKRSFVGGMIDVGALSEMYTQDVEDLGTFSQDIIEGTFTDAEPVSPVHGTSADYTVIDEAVSMPEKAPPTVTAPTKAVPISDLAKARAVVLRFGKHNGTTMGALEDSKDTEGYLVWIVKNLDEKEGTKYHEERVALKAAAQMIIDARGQSAPTTEATEVAANITELRGQIRLMVKDFWPSTEHDGHVTYVLKQAPFDMTESFRDLTIEQLEHCVTELRAMDERRTAAATGGKPVVDEEAPPGFEPAEDIPF